MKKRISNVVRPYLRCPECDSRNFYYRTGSGTLLCRHCGCSFVTNINDPGSTISMNDLFNKPKERKKENEV